MKFLQLSSCTFQPDKERGELFGGGCRQDNGNAGRHPAQLKT